MSTLLKDLLSPSFYKLLSEDLNEIVPSFNKQRFLKLIFDKNWNVLELKDRIRHTSSVLHQFMPDDFSKASKLLCDLIVFYENKGLNSLGLAYWFIPDYIEQYGLDHFKDSVQAMEKVTQCITCEFAVRPFLLKYEDKMRKQMLHWSKHKKEHVRRLASEGMRPRLPWAMAIPSLKKDPALILPILENLKSDPSEFVRRSVANNLNDISKDHPDMVLSTLNKWKGKSVETDKLIKHGARTLLKAGHRKTLNLFGYKSSETIELSEFKILSNKIKIGQELHFKFSLKNNHKKKQMIRIEYALYFLKANGQHGKKVFKISEREYGTFESAAINRKHNFRIITTRTYYKGAHHLSLILNGNEQETFQFSLG